MVDDRGENGKDIVEQKFQAPSTSTEAKQYGVDLAPEDQVMPRLALLQPTSDHEGAGKFYFSLTGETFDKVECVIFSNARGRVMFDPDISKRVSICGSDDRLIPSDRFEKPKSNDCMKCSFSNRNYTEKVIVGNKEIDMYCSETMTLRAMFVDSLMPFLFVGRRSSIFAVNEFLSVMQFETVKHRKPLCCFPIRMTTKLGKGANKYWVPVIERLPMIEREEFVAMMK
jgi:hypothetical protein